MPQTYVTLADLRALYPGNWIEECLGNAQLRDANGRSTGYEPANDAQLASIFEAAAEEANAYVGAAYALPLPVVPPLLKAAVADLARYRIYAAPKPEHIETLYANTVALLVRISKGTATLGISQSAASPSAVGRISAPTRKLGMASTWDF